MATSPPPPPQRQRSNSFPIVEALGCSTPEAKLILAEGQAARRKRRAHSRRNQSVNDTTSITTFRPQDHMQYLQALSPQTKSDQSQLSHSKSCHARIPSDATDRSSATVVAVSSDGQSRPNASPTSPLGNYSAHLAQFIKAQLSNIPTYTGECSTALLSPRSCPDLPSGRDSPPSPQRIARRPLEAPKVIEIPPVQPPVRSQFSAWSSTDDETEDDELSMVDAENEDSDVISKGSNYTPSVFHYYGISNNSSFLLSSTPLEEDSPDTAKASTFPHREQSPSAVESLTDDDTGYPSSAMSRPELASSSAPSITSTASTSSYFECKRPLSLTNELKGRIMAAVMPPTTTGKTIAAVSPWEGAPLSNVHDVFIESQHRVHVDGMSFDMQRDFVLPSHIGTPC